MHRVAAVAALTLLLAPALAGCAQPAAAGNVLRLGYLPNLTHAQAVYGIQTGLFAERLGNGTRFEARAFNAGPEAFEALFAGQVDVLYVGPSPTIAALAAAEPGTLRVISGAASGGARFVVQPHLALAAPADYAGRTFATPQLGNTQDVALKRYLLGLGLRTRDAGGDVRVVNAANADILLLFERGLVDGAWVPEPWATRLVEEGHGRALLDEASLWPGGAFVTTQIVTTSAYLDAHPAEIRRLLEAHVEATQRLAADGDAGLALVDQGIAATTGKALPAGLSAEAAKSLRFTLDPLSATLFADARAARDLGFLTKDLPPASSIYDLRILDDVLRERGLPQVSA